MTMTMTTSGFNFGDLRSLLAQPSFHTEKLHALLSHYKGDEIAALQYIKDHLGYVPASLWAEGSETLSKDRLFNLQPTRKTAITFLRDREHTPLKAYILIGGKYIMIKSWEDPHLDIQRAVYPIREDNLQQVLQGFSDTRRDLLDKFFCEVMLKHKEYLEDYSEILKQNLSSDSLSSTIETYARKLEWEIFLTRERDSEKRAKAFSAFSGSNLKSAALGLRAEAVLCTSAYDVIHRASRAGIRQEAIAENLSQYAEQINVALLRDVRL